MLHLSTVASFMQLVSERIAVYSEVEMSIEYLASLLIQPEFHAFSEEGLIRLTVGDAAGRTWTGAGACSFRRSLRPSRGTIGGQTFFGIFFHVDRNLAGSVDPSIVLAHPSALHSSSSPEAILVAHSRLPTHPTKCVVGII